MHGRGLQQSFIQPHHGDQGLGMDSDFFHRSNFMAVEPPNYYQEMPISQPHHPAFASTMESNGDVYMQTVSGHHYPQRGVSFESHTDSAPEAYEYEFGAFGF
jgi:hypothetical protein